MNQIKSIRKLCFIPLLFLLLFSLSGCASSAEPLQMNGMYFDTIVTIRIWDTSDRSVLEECEKLCKNMKICSAGPLIPVMFPGSIRQTDSL